MSHFFGSLKNDIGKSISVYFFKRIVFLGAKFLDLYIKYYKNFQNKVSHFFVVCHLFKKLNEINALSLFELIDEPEQDIY